MNERVIYKRTKRSVDQSINRSINQLENVAISNALQLEAARRHASPIPLQLRRHVKFEIAEPIHCRIITANTLLYAVTLTSDHVTLTFDLEHLQCIACYVVELCTKSERNRANRGGSHCDFNI